jgi:hypothetical protein
MANGVRRSYPTTTSRAARATRASTRSASPKPSVNVS